MCNVINITANTTGNMSANEFGITNTKLAEITDEIIAYAFNMRLYGLLIAAKVSYIKENAETLLTDFDGDIVRYGKEVLGTEKAQTYAMARTGKYFLDKDGNCLLPEPEDVRYNKTQLQALLGLVDSKTEDTSLVYQLAESNEISPTMTVTEIKKVVREHKNDMETPEAKVKREEREAKAEKREAEKVAMEQATIGSQIATIQIFELSTGAYRVVINGEDSKDKRRNAAILKYAGVITK